MCKLGIINYNCISICFRFKNGLKCNKGEELFLPTIDVHCPIKVNKKLIQSPLRQNVIQIQHSKLELIG